MYVKPSFLNELKVAVIEKGRNEDVEGRRGVSEEIDDWESTSMTSDPSSEDTTVTSVSDNFSSVSTTGVTPPGGDGGEEEEPKKKWLLPVIIGAGCLLLVVAVVAVIYRRGKCFGWRLPFMRKQFQLAQPIKKFTDSMRSSISSSFSSTRGSLSEGDKELKRFKKYAVRLDARRTDRGSNAGSSDAAAEGLGWIDEKDFSGEFEAMKRGDLKDVPMTVALKSENIPRNRFSNVLPYDRSRVVLATTVSSNNDYINASYVSGYKKEEEFICTQGPLKHTVTDFWRMCWETQASAIVMLTKCYEKKQEKCYPYWPSGNAGHSTFGEIKVTLERKTAWKLQASGDPLPEDDATSDNAHLWLVSEMQMEKEGVPYSKGILHIVFLSWPDFGVVDPPKCLVGFVKNVQRLILKSQASNQSCDHSQYNGPIVVHCSAGVGRSGVFIAVHQLIQQLEEIAQERRARSQKGLPESARTKSVNIFQLVTKMRTERFGMVQNILQYTLIYKCLQVLAKTSPTGTAAADNEEPAMVNPDMIQGSDWGLVEANNNL